MATAIVLTFWLLLGTRTIISTELPRALTAADAQKSERANGLVEAGKAAEAISLYKELANTYPHDLRFRVNLAIALYKLGRFREAADECEALVKVKSDLFPALLFLGASRLKLGEDQAAEGDLRKALRINPNDPNARVMLGDVLLERQQWEEAAREYETVRPMLQDNPRVLFGLYRAYDASAGIQLERLENSTDGAAEALALEGQIDFDRGQLTAAFQRFRAALAQKPALHGIQDRLIEIYERTGHADWAMTQKGTARHTEGTCDAAALECDFNAGRLQEVAKSGNTYWQGRALHALSRQAYTRLQETAASRERSEAAALEEENSGRYREAVVAWKEALQMDPGDAQLERRLALALCHSNDCASALPILTAQLARTPNSAELNYLCGLVLVDIRKPGEAISHLEKALALDPSFLPAHGALGEAYLESGNAERAIPHLQKATKADEDGTRLYQLVRAYQLTNRRDLAAGALVEFRDIARQRADTEAAITAP